ncbi:MAG: choice-of-anchor Q domain-containing protein [Candidatus Zhuqueibacterota bacterium]
MSRSILLFGLILFMFGAVTAGTIKVPGDQPTIQAGINAATNGDTVLVADGTYFENINFKGKAITVASYFFVDNDTTHINNTIIDGSQPSHADTGSVVLFISGEDTTSILYGFTITNGSGSVIAERRRGGGICIFNSGATIVHNKVIANSITHNQECHGGGIAATCDTTFGRIFVQIIGNTITHNQAISSQSLYGGFGGGVDIAVSNVLLTSNVISHNKVSAGDYCYCYGAGVRIEGSTEISLVTDNIISFNTPINGQCYGGGLLAGSNDLTIKGNLFEGNNSEEGGGIFYNSTGGVISHNTFVNNHSYAGGGIKVNSSEEGDIFGNKFIGNTTDGRGGGICISFCSPHIYNNIIAQNRTSGFGGGIYIGEYFCGPQIINNIIVDNTANTGGGIYTELSWPIVMNTILWGNVAATDPQIYICDNDRDFPKTQVVYSDIQGGWAGTGNINTDPLFADTLFHLSDASPCIGAGASSFTFTGGIICQAPVTDFAGQTRPDPTGSKPDIGAFEVPRAAPERPTLCEVPTDYATIQAGIEASTTGDTVLVCEGTYYENINFRGKAIAVASLFIMEGDTNHINNTTINGSRPSDPNKGSVVSFVTGEDTTSVICGFTITGGTGTMFDATYRVGGGIYCKTSGARISHNKIVSNTINHTADCDGGGVGYWPHINSSARFVIIEDNVVESNSITSSNGESYLNGGGIHIVKGRVTGNTIRYNSVGGQPIFAGGGGISATCENNANRTTVVITGNTITHNRATTPGYYGGWGAGIDVVMCHVQILDNIITHNEAGGDYGMGAGIRLWGSKAISIIKNNTISFNSVTAPGAGGGIELDQTQGVQVIGNWIESNNGSLGGGGIDESRCPTGNIMDGNFIKDNLGGEQGGGIWAMNAKLVNNVIVENEARRGGGIFYYFNPTLTSSVTQIINNTITKNVADTAGGIAIYNANAVVMNTICWGNTAPHGQEIEVWGGSLNAAHSDIQLGAAGIVIDSPATVNWAVGNIDANPLFADSTLTLSNGSPCIGKGVASFDFGGFTCTCPETDKTGEIRPNPADSKPDMGAYESPLSTDVENPWKTEIPQSYLLGQNYPNPFNPTTTISYQLPTISQVDLSIYNMIGQKVATLVSARQPAGFYNVHWDASAVASGVYLYRLEAGDTSTGSGQGFVQVKKLILMR